MIAMKTISGHYGSVFSLDHNNRYFIPNNCNPERLDRNYYPVIAGGELPFELPDLRFTNEMWKKYSQLQDIYWRNRALAKEEEYEKLRRILRKLYQRDSARLIEDGGIVGLALGLLFLPLLIANDIAIEIEYDKAMEAWETFNNEQFVRDMMFIANKNSLRDALRSYDLQAGTNNLRVMDNVVKDMARLAGDLVNASDRYVIPPATKPRFATLEEIYDKLYEPAFRAFQEKQRPCRRYDGKYLQYIREQERNPKECPKQE